ncbi:MAG: hypothetical protein NUV42_02610, partial [Candidatus Yonathbacteria bacterium]|nr:hypothetical protein [Candidatus Yonathbacteria bacterium]
KRANLHYSVDKMGITKNIFQRQEKNRPKNKDKAENLSIHNQLYTEAASWNIDFHGMIYASATLFS